MIWDLTTVNKIRGMSIDQYLTFEQLDQATYPLKAQQHVIDQMADQLVEAYQTLAVDVDRNHLRVDMFRNEARMQMQYKMYWLPSTLDAELRGGPDDGKVITTVNLSLPIHMATFYLDPPSSIPTEDEISRSMHDLIYELAGWNEETQHWVFDLQSPTKGEAHGN